MDDSIELEVNGTPVRLAGSSGSLMEALRGGLGLVSVKDGCSPQGQCGCCTVLVDGRPRVSCVTPLRRVAGRRVTTLEGLDPEDRARWSAAFLRAGGSQCGFCTPGIIMRCNGSPGAELNDPVALDRALAAHVCRCTGWQTIVEAVADAAGAGTSVEEPGRDLVAAARRAELEGGAPQRVAADVALGRGPFADDLAPGDALVGVRDGSGAWHLAPSLSEARSAAGRIQGRNTTTEVVPPLEPAPGTWDLVLATSWVEPAYLETDSVWCAPGGDPVGPLTNGGAFGAKDGETLRADARRLAEEAGRPVRLRWTREDVVSLGPKRPPISAALRADGTGSIRVVRTPGIVESIRSALPAVDVEEVEVAGPPTSAAIRGAGWAEAAVLAAVLPLAATSRAERVAAARGGIRVATPDGAVAVVRWSHARLLVDVDAGEPLDEVVLRSYVIGAVHMGLGWVCSEGLAVDPDGAPRDLTVRSFGIVRPADMPPVDVTAVASTSPPRAVSGAVMAATAALAWLAADLAPVWPVGRGPRGLLAELDVATPPPR